MKDSIPDIYVVDGNITIFCGSHSNEFKSDILHSSLYSQLVANTESSAPATRYNFYKNLLEKLHWQTDKLENNSTKNIQSSIFSIAEFALSSTVQQNELQQLAMAFSAINKLPGDSPVIEAIINKIQAGHLLCLDSSKADPIEETLLTLSTLLTIVRNDKSLVTLQVSFQTTKAVTIEMLDQPIPVEAMPGNTETRLWCSHLIEGQYSAARDEIIKKLGSKAKTHLLHVSASALLD